MNRRGYFNSNSDQKSAVGYSYAPVLSEETRKEVDIARLDHKIACANKITILLSHWLQNSFIAFGILCVILLGIAGCYLTGLYLGSLA